MYWHYTDSKLSILKGRKLENQIIILTVFCIQKDRISSLHLTKVFNAFIKELWCKVTMLEVFYFLAFVYPV